MEQKTSLREKLFQWPDDFGGNEISELGNIKKEKSKHQKVKDNHTSMVQPLQWGRKKNIYKNIIKPNKNSKNCVGRMGHQVCPPPPPEN